MMNRTKGQAMLETILSIVGAMLFLYGFMVFFKWVREDMKAREGVYRESFTNTTKASYFPEYKSKPLEIIK